MLLNGAILIMNEIEYSWYINDNGVWDLCIHNLPPTYKGSVWEYVRSVGGDTLILKILTTQPTSIISCGL
jgi:hypothetical protein